ncbi:hypothetical protein G6027_06155 [Dietzia sp. SLG310A2-38A2]|nr:hypothetical protein [Dietzia sp. SLG310A2-38A2]MBB1030473.1 hypothetical protein [Dietzia sp. SLG310A2-38A2]
MPHPAFLGPVSTAVMNVVDGLTRMNAPLEVTTALTSWAWDLADLGS